jgi:hypothetical protein
LIYTYQKIGLVEPFARWCTDESRSEDDTTMRAGILLATKHGWGPTSDLRVMIHTECPWEQGIDKRVWRAPKES